MKNNSIWDRLHLLFITYKALWLETFGNRKMAIPVYEKSLKMAPHNAPNLKSVGILLIEHDRYEEGIHRLQEALQYFPGSEKSRSEIFAYIGHGYAELEQLDKAITYYQKALYGWEQDGEFLTRSDVWYNLGRLYLQKKLILKAKEMFTEGIQRDPQDARMHFGIGIVYYELDLPNESLSHLTTALSLDPALKDDTTMMRLHHQLGSRKPIQ